MIYGILILVGLIMGLIVYLIFKNHLKFVNSLKVGDEVFYEGLPCKLIKKVNDHKFLIEIEVSSLKMSKK